MTFFLLPHPHAFLISSSFSFLLFVFPFFLFVFLIHPLLLELRKFVRLFDGKTSSSSSSSSSFSSEDGEKNGVIDKSEFFFFLSFHNMNNSETIKRNLPESSVRNLFTYFDDSEEETISLESVLPVLLFAFVFLFLSPVIALALPWLFSSPFFYSSLALLALPLYLCCYSSLSLPLPPPPRLLLRLPFPL
jgi:hypothetical protein